MKLLSSIVVTVVCFQLCLTQEVPDITAIYHVGRNSSADYVDIHLHTDALGLPVLIQQQLIGPQDLEFHLDSYNFNTWEHVNWTLVTANRSSFSSFYPSVFHDVKGFSSFHPFYEGVDINIKRKETCEILGLALTSDKRPLKLQTNFYYMEFNDYRCGRTYMYRCSARDYSSSFSRGEEKLFCSHMNDFYQGSYITSVRITQENDVLNLWTYDFDSLPTYKWDSGVRIKFLKIFSGEDKVKIEVVPLVKFLETTSVEAKLISPPFTPKYKNLCIAAVFYTGDFTKLNSVDVYVQHMLSDRVFLGSFETDRFMTHWHTKRLVTRWPDGITSSKARLLFETSMDVGNFRLERISSCNAEDGEDVILLEDDEIVPFFNIGMPMLRYKDDYSLPFPPFPYEEELCWHNGVRTLDYRCACPPGFGGSTCEKGCGQNRYGKDCKGKCSIQPSQCSGLLLCTPLAGCFCAPGYRGDTCEEKCASGKYGNNCTQTCGHCKEGTCDIYSGKCSICLPGYKLPLCHEKYDYTLYAPEINITTFGEVTVTPQLGERTHNANPLFYTIQYKKEFASEPWTSYNTYPIPRTVVAQEIVIKGLEHGVPYLVRTILIDADLNSYQGDDVPSAKFTSLCIIPEKPDYRVKVVTDQTSFTVSWKYILENIYWCPVEKFEVSWKGGWNWITDFTDKTIYTVSGLLPSTSLKLKLRAHTTNGSAPFSSVSEFYTKSSTVPEPVQNLRVVTTTGKSARIRWSPPLGLETAPLTYVVNYKCLEQVACQKQCSESSAELHTTNTSISLEFLHPLSQYLVTVSAGDGPTSSIILGTKMTAAVETPEPSSEPPVKTNTTITVYWNRPDVCSGFFNNFVYQIYKAGNPQMLQTGSTLNTSVTFGNLQVSTEYRVLVYIRTSFDDINYDKYLEINASTSATVPDQVRNLTVYKRGRHLLGLRWASPANIYGPIVSFTVKYGYGENSLYKTEKIKPSRCVVWPDLFCHTVTSLQPDRMYTISVSARNSEVDADGTPAEIQGITKEKTPGPPENVKLLNKTSTSFFIQWDYPWMANGIIRSFLVNIEETEQFEEEKCCQIFPISETTVTSELEHYVMEVSGLHAASTYAVSVNAKTASIGLSQTMTIHTRPPPLPIVQLPNVVIETPRTLTWLPQQPNFVNNSDIYKPLIKGTLILVVSNDTEFNSTGIQSEKLSEEMKTVVPGNFYVAAEYTSHETEIQLGTDETVDSKWGMIHNAPLQEANTYQVAVMQITEYCGEYNLDIVWSVPFEAS